MNSLNSPVPRFLALFLLACAATLPVAGCRNVPGKPGPEPEVARPEQLADFATLYSQNCASCHGVHGRNAAAISLANPVYLALAGVANIQRVTANGIPGTTMPPFSKAAGAMLTDRQITILAEGMERNWGRPDALAGRSASWQRHRNWIFGRFRIPCSDQRSRSAQHYYRWPTRARNAGLALALERPGSAPHDRSGNYRRRRMAHVASHRIPRAGLQAAPIASGDTYERTRPSRRTRPAQ